MGARAAEPTSSEAAVASPLRSGLRAGPQAPGRRLRGQDQSQAAASAQRFSKGLTRSPELHRSHGRSHAGVKGHEVDSTPPLRVSPRRGRGAWPAGSLGPGGSRGVTATPPWSPPPPPNPRDLRQVSRSSAARPADPRDRPRHIGKRERFSDFFSVVCEGSRWSFQQHGPGRLVATRR